MWGLSSTPPAHILLDVWLLHVWVLTTVTLYKKKEGAQNIYNHLTVHRRVVKVAAIYQKRPTPPSRYTEVLLEGGIHTPITMRSITSMLLLTSFGLILVGLTTASPVALAPARDLHELINNNRHLLLPRQSTTTTDSATVNRTTCGFDGDSDTYGLGIRIGVYTQWASGVIANWYVTEMVHTMRVRATLFQMAMAIALAFITIRKPRPYAVDALIMIVFLLGSVYFPPYSPSSRI